MSETMLVRWQKDGVEEDRVHLIAGDSGDEDHEDARESGSDIQQDSPQRGSELGKERRRVAKTPRIVYVIAFFSIIGGFLFGYDTSVIAGALLELDRDFHLDATQKELVVSITVAAAALGAVCGGPLNEIVGRKKTIMVASVVFALGAVVMAGAPPASWGWSVVLIGRFIVGISIGISSMTVPIYLAECAPVHLRGRLTVADVMALTGGQFVATVTDYGFSYVGQGWRFMLGLAAIPAVVRFVAFFFLPESPRWLVGRGKREAARAVLLRLRRGGGERREGGRGNEGGGGMEGEEEVERELKEIQENLEQNAKENSLGILKKLWTMLTTRHLLLALVVGCGLQAIQQLSGINTVMYYSPTILRMAGIVDDHTAIGLGAVVALGNFVFTLMGFYLVERSGRRKLILSSLCGVIVSLVVLGMAFFLANTASPTAFAPASLNTNDSSSSGCRVYSKTCSVWKNCNDCVVDDDCHYCVFNGSYNSHEAIGLCTSSRDSDFYRDHQCFVPDDVINYTTTTADSDQCYSLEAQNATVQTFEYCPSDFAWLTMAALVMYIVAFSPGMGPVPWTVNAEIYPNWARSVGNSAATTVNWTSNLLISITFLHVTRYFTRYGAFWLYSVIALGGWVFLFLLLPETKGKSLEDVEELFQRPLCPPPGLSGGCGGRCGRQAYFRLTHRQGGTGGHEDTAKSYDTD